MKAIDDNPVKRFGLNYIQCPHCLRMLEVLLKEAS